MNTGKTINRIKKRADILTDFFIEKYEKLEQKTYELVELNNRNHLKLREHEIVFEKVLDNVDKIEKFENGEIEVKYKEPNTNNIVAIPYFVGSALYPFAEMLLEKYRDRKEFEWITKSLRDTAFEPKNEEPPQKNNQ